MVVLPSPPFLQKGDCIGIMAPAGQLTDVDAFSKGIAILKEMGFAVKYPRDLWPGAGYLADCDDRRAGELHDLFRDSEVKALLSVRGGFGCLRLLDYLDLELIKEFPKLIIGFSDITILQNHLYQRLQLPSIHGPVLTSLCNLSDQALERFFLTVTGQYDHPVKVEQLEILKSGGDVKAPLIGGNLASLVSLLGTRFDQSWEGNILLLEDINEPLYKVDRMLTQLSHAGKFNGLKAILLGDFSLSETSLNITEKYRYQEAIWQRLLELCGRETYPIWANLPYGHFPGNFAVPIGLPVNISHSSGQLWTTPH